MTALPQYFAPFAALTFSVIVTIAAAAFFIGRRLGALNNQVASNTADIDNMATKDDIIQLQERIESIKEIVALSIEAQTAALTAELRILREHAPELATKADLGSLATKAELTDILTKLLQPAGRVQTA